MGKIRISIPFANHGFSYLVCKKNSYSVQNSKEVCFYAWPFDSVKIIKLYKNPFPMCKSRISLSGMQEKNIFCAKFERSLFLRLAFS